MSEHFPEEVIQNFQRKIIALNKNDQIYEAKKEYYKNAMEEDLMLLNLLKKIKGKEDKISKNKWKKKWLFRPQKNKNDCWV